MYLKASPPYAEFDTRSNLKWSKEAPAKKRYPEYEITPHPMVLPVLEIWVVCCTP